MYMGSPWNQPAFSRGGVGGTPIYGNKLGRVQLVPEVEKEILALLCPIANVRQRTELGFH